jgi:hypothetical protein
MNRGHEGTEIFYGGTEYGAEYAEYGTGKEQAIRGQKNKIYKLETIEFKKYVGRDPFNC